jgi:hypothetical protein
MVLALRASQRKETTAVKKVHTMLALASPTIPVDVRRVPMPT